MAHHSSTSASILDAPSRTVVQTHTPYGATRQERRHGVAAPADLTPTQLAVYLHRLNSVRNAPARRGSARRGRRVIRGRAA